MPAAEEVKSSWADEVELEGGALPPSTEVFENGHKIVTEYKYNEDGKKVKIIRTYKIEKRFVSKSIALRKTWKKFGESANDKPGPNPATTIVGEDVYMQFISSKEEDKAEDEGIDKLKALGDKTLVKCRTCGGDHWTSKCPWKDTILAGGQLPDDKKSSVQGGPAATEANKSGGSKYVPPSLREGAVKNLRSDGTNMSRKEDNYCAIRIGNLSDSVTEADLEELVKPFGPVHKLFLAKDKQTGYCKGFAYVHFKFRNDAASAVARLDGHGYDHLILSVDWSKPMNNQ